MYGEIIIRSLYVHAVSHHIKVVEKAQKENKFNEREEAYIQALQSFASGDLLKATDELISILMKYPLGEQCNHGRGCD